MDMSWEEYERMCREERAQKARETLLSLRAWVLFILMIAALVSVYSAVAWGE
jgi:hypothetical protein